MTKSYEEQPVGAIIALTKVILSLEDDLQAEERTKQTDADTIRNLSQTLAAYKRETTQLQEAREMLKKMEGERAQLINSLEAQTITSKQWKDAHTSTHQLLVERDNDIEALKKSVDMWRKDFDHMKNLFNEQCAKTRKARRELAQQKRLKRK